MVNIKNLSKTRSNSTTGFRLVNSKFPPISIFEEVADEEDYDAIHRIQARTNPRLLAEAGKFNLIPKDEIPFGITGCSYAVAPFAHVNPNGSRFSDGSYGVLYIADQIDTAIEEVKHHQSMYWRAIPGLNYERLVFRALKCQFNEGGLVSALSVHLSDEMYSESSYSHSRILGSEIHQSCYSGIKYQSVRRKGAKCWGLMTPKQVKSIIQTSHYQFVWNGKITSVNKI